MLSGRVFLTGGAGFLGRGIMLVAQQENWPCEFVVYSRDEQKHWKARKNFLNARYVIGDILHMNRMTELMSLCDYAIHTAAIKYIPECEAQPSEAMRVNIDGVHSVMLAAKSAAIKRTAMISTDKAAGPINTYGMTKALMERLVWETAEYPALSGAEFVACRYGNVIASTGSVWHVFKQQAAEIGKLRVTDPDMTRFFFSVEDAVRLIAHSFTAKPGTVIVPQPRAVKIGDLASYITQKWGLGEPEIMGPRDGEKQHESMITQDETVRMAPMSGGYYLMLGPTQRIAQPRVTSVEGFTSDTADEMSPEEFVEIAERTEAL